MQPSAEIELATRERNEMVDVTDRVQQAVDELGLTDSAVLVSSPHTTAGVTVNEGYDPDVARDLLYALEQIVPQQGYRHAEGNSDSHVKVALVGSSQVVPVRGGRLALGRWQRVFFCEFDGPRTRRLEVSPVSS